MKFPKMYNELAHFWSLLSNPDDYAEEAQLWRMVLMEKLGGGRHKILELGVGGGHNLSHLADTFDATAIDVSEKMLRNSRKLNPDVRHFKGDMRTFRLEEKFRAVLIHDAISYMLNVEDLRRTLSTASYHLEAGGVVIIGPDWFRETFSDPKVYHCTRSDNQKELTYVEYVYDPDPNDTTVEMLVHYFIREKGKELRVEEDRHVLGLFPMQTWLDLISEAGFTVETWPYNVFEDGSESYLLSGVKQ